MFFQCTICRDIIGYLQILDLCCLIRGPIFPSDDSMDRPYGDLASSPCNVDGHSVKFNMEAYSDAKRLVEICDLHPAVTTAETMDLRDVWAKCVTCSNQGIGDLVMRWRAAVSFPDLVWETR